RTRRAEVFRSPVPLHDSVRALKKVVGRELLGGFSPSRPDFGSLNNTVPAGDLSDDSTNDFVLDKEIDVSHLAIELLRPDTHALFGVGKVCGDADVVAGTLDTAF